MSSAYQLFHKRKERSTDRIELIETGGLTSSTDGLSSPAPAALQDPGPMRSSALSGTRTSGRNGPGGRLLRGGKNQKGFARFGLPKGAFKIYLDDLYHTLLNMPRYRFLMSFFSVYFLLYLAFAFIYWGVKPECIITKDERENYSDMTFAFAFWFSVQTASTIGYSSYLVPDPICGGVNFLVTIQIICAALIDTMLMSLVFARFAAPMPRASTIRFSQHAVLYRRESAASTHGSSGSNTRGCWVLSFRLANIRRHTLLDPEISLLLAVPDRLSGVVGVQSAYHFVSLPIEDHLTQVTSLKLGLPAAVCHVITPSSPLWDLSVAEMEMREMELLCFMSGTDPMTSNMLQARHAYLPADIRMNERFAAVGLRTNDRGKDGLDLTAFDDTCRADVSMGRDESTQMLYPLPTSSAPTPGDVRSHMAQLRTWTFASLTRTAVTEAGAAANGAGNGLQAYDPLAGSVQVERSGAGAGGAGAHSAVDSEAWDRDVAALCEAVVADGSASASVQQQAAVLLAAMRAVPKTVPAPPPAALPMQAASVLPPAASMAGTSAGVLPSLPVSVMAGGHVSGALPAHLTAGKAGGSTGGGHSRTSSGGTPALPQSTHHSELI